MAFLGRESEADQRRALAVRAWVAARTPYSLGAVMLGLLAVLDSFTLVIGVACGLAAIVLGVLGLRDLRRDPTKLGKRLCITGIALGVLGLVLSLAMAFVVYPWLASGP